MAVCAMRRIWLMLLFSTLPEAGYVLMGFGIGGMCWKSRCSMVA